MAEMKALTNEAILAIEKKMKMTLDDLIKDSKKQNKNSSAEKKKINTRRVSNKTHKPFHNSGSATARDKSSKLQRFTDSISSHRQAAFALRRSNFQENNKFSVPKDTGKRAAPVQRRQAVVYIATKKWNDQGRMMVPTQRPFAAQKWNNQARILLPKKKSVEATRKKSVWQRLSVVPSRNQF